MSENPKHIPSIYNYCDRWCERCYFTSHCAAYDSTSDLNLELNDNSNKAFWNHLSQTLEKAADLLRKVSEKIGIDLTRLPKSVETETNTRNEKREKNLKHHQLIILCKSYMEKAIKFLKQAEFIKQHSLESVMPDGQSLINSTHETVKIAIGIKDYIDVIQWYLYFIHAKLSRALTGKWEDSGWQEANGFPKDSDGSAKIALIAVDRSIKAWLKLHEIVTDEEDAIIEIMGFLEKIKAIALKEFPDAQKFVRPGFDEQSKGD